MRVDVDAIVRSRLPRYARFIPRPLTWLLERIIHQDRINKVLERSRGQSGSEFCRTVLDELAVTYRLVPGCTLPPATERRVLYVCNHPLGGLDGVAIIDMLTRHYGCEPWFLVNDLLMALTPLRSVFLPVNKHGRQSRADIEAIDRAFDSDRPVVIFPAGLVSRKGAGGVIADLEWKKMFIGYAIKYRRDVVPLYFDGENSRFFYNFARLRTRLGLKFNIEMIRLPHEMVLAEHRQFDIYAGQPLAWSSFTGGSNARSEARQVKQLVYLLKNQHHDGKDN